MTKASPKIKDIDSAAVNRNPACVVLAKVNAPFTTVVGRAQCTDFSKDLFPRFGIDRVMTQAIMEVPGEVGLNASERVFKPINDIHDAVRFVGKWLSVNDTTGVQVSSEDNGSYCEITFYGTGLNLLCMSDSNSGDIRASVNGGALTGNLMPNMPSVISLRSYTANIVINVASGLTLGLHTVRLTTPSSATVVRVRFSGYEVLNTNPTLQLTPGTSYLGGARQYTPSLSTAPYNSGFETGALGAKGGCVLVYQKQNGTIAKAVTPTNASAAYLAAADHTNERAVRSHNFREFGAGRGDDFSFVNSNSGLFNGAFTLDDGTTTLVAYQCSLAANVELIAPAAVGGFLTFTFVGTGLDIIRQDDNTPVDNYSVTVDGVGQGNLPSLGISGTPRVSKIASGLPYGTHTVKITRLVAATGAIRVKDFIVYAPAPPALPSGTVALGQYYLMADFAPNGAAGLETVATGVLRKSPMREFVYTGTGVAIGGPDGGLYIGGWQPTSPTSGAAFRYTFYGTGFELRGRANTVFSTNITVSIDGSVNWSAFASSAYGGFSIVNAATGQISQGVSNTLGSGVRISGLSLGLHTVVVTNNAALSFIVEALDIITPVHAPKINGPAVIQNTLSVGSQGIGDLRQFSAQQVLPLKASGQAVGIANNAANAGSVNTDNPTPDLSLTLKTSGGPILIAAQNSVVNGTQAFMRLMLYVNGAKVGANAEGFLDTPTADVQLSNTFIARVPAGYHKIDAYWMTNTGAMICNATNRSIIALEQ